MQATHIVEELTLQFEIEIQAPVSKVWEKLASQEAMNEWFARDLIFEHRIGGRFQMQGEQPGDGPYRFTGKVVNIEAERELSFTWTSELGEKGEWPTSTLVTFRLRPTETGTKVTLIHTGFAELGEELGKSAYEGHLQGWTLSGTLDDLKATVES